MPAFISKQPNGKYCRYSTQTDSVTHYNMTAEQYIEYCAQRARKEAKDVLEHHLQPFSMIERYVEENQNTNDYDILLDMRMHDGEYTEIPF